LITIQSIGAQILPIVLAQLREDDGAVRVRIMEALAGDVLLAAVESGEADVGLTALPIADGPFEVHRLLSDEYVLVTSVARSERELSDLGGTRLLGIRGCRNDQLVEQRLLAQGIVPSAIERFDDNGMIQALVAAGEGVAVVPSLVVDLADPRVVAHQLPELLPRQLVVVIHRDRRPANALGRFLDATVGVCAALETAAPGAQT
jgi:DNA-binding transcriptional LysR family regulator